MNSFAWSSERLTVEISHISTGTSVKILEFFYIRIFLHQKQQIIDGKCVGGLENTHRRLLGAQSILEKHDEAFLHCWGVTFQRLHINCTRHNWKRKCWTKQDLRLSRLFFEFHLHWAWSSKSLEVKPLKLNR